MGSLRNGLMGLLLLGMLGALGACQRGEPELLVVYSGDGQAYLEPCG